MIEKRKALNYIVGLIQISGVWCLWWFMDGINPAISLLGAVTFSVFILYFYLNHHGKIDKLQWTDLISFVSLIFGGLATAFTTVYTQNPVLSASMIGLLGFGLSKRLKNGINEKVAQSVYCGTFVGMANLDSISNETFGVSLFLTATLFVFSSNLLNGYGGKLGTLAFVGSFIGYFLLGGSL